MKPRHGLSICAVGALLVGLSIGGCSSEGGLPGPGDSGETTNGGQTGQNGGSTSGPAGAAGNPGVAGN